MNLTIQLCSFIVQFTLSYLFCEYNFSILINNDFNVSLISQINFKDYKLLSYDYFDMISNNIKSFLIVNKQNDLIDEILK